MQELNTFKCGQCHFEFEGGAKVCQGCNGDIVYGATPHEIGEAGKTGAIIWGVVTLLFFYLVPDLLNDWFGSSFKAGYGLGFWPFLGVAVASIVGYATASASAASKLSGQCRTFR